MSSEFDPALLGAYVDGELSPEEIAKVERHLAGSPEDRRTVEALRAMNVHLAAAFEAPLRAPLTPTLREHLGGRTPRRRVRSWWPVVTSSALAASVALAVGYVIGGDLVGSRQPALAAGDLSRSSPLHALLESESTGSSTSLTRGAATLGSTFFDGQGRPCREIELTEGANASRTWTIACRQGEHWLIEVAVIQPGARPDARDEYVPAAGVGDEVIDAALDALRAGPVLEPGEVEDLIDAHWNPL